MRVAFRQAEPRIGIRDFSRANGQLTFEVENPDQLDQARRAIDTVRTIYGGDASDDLIARFFGESRRLVGTTTESSLSQ